MWLNDEKNFSFPSVKDLLCYDALLKKIVTAKFPVKSLEAWKCVNLKYNVFTLDLMTEAMIVPTISDLVISEVGNKVVHLDKLQAYILKHLFCGAFFRFFFWANSFINILSCLFADLWWRESASHSAATL